MKARANQCVYWPGMDASIRNYRDTCLSPTCVKHRQSQQVEPLILTPIPEWPFRQICLDYFFIEHHAYLVIVDRYSGWLCIYHCQQGAATSANLINICRELFTVYGVPEEISSDGGPQFKSQVFNQFLLHWGIHHRLSSAGYAQSNGRAEAAVKSAKRIIRDNLGPNGSLHTNQAVQAILQYRNTPLSDCKLSPAQILFHRQLRDTIPSHPHHYQLHEDWLLAAKEREQQQSLKHQGIMQQHDLYAKQLPPLNLGQEVVIQGLDKKWSKHGKVVEVLTNRQYRIRLAGSGRLTLQNRRFLRLITNITPPQNILPSPSNSTPVAEPTPQEVVVPDITHSAEPPVPELHPLPESILTEPVSPEPVSTEPVSPEPVSPEPVLPERAVPRPSRIPRSLKNLVSFNKPGIKE